MQYWYFIPIGMTGAVLLKTAETKGAMKAGLFLKAFSSLAFVLFGLLSGRFDFSGSLCTWILLGLIFGAAGDVVLNIRHLVHDSMRLFYLGGFLFLLGHICYAAALAPVASGSMAAVLAAAALLSAADLFVIYRSVQAGAGFKGASAVYLYAVAFVVCCAGCLLLQDPSHSGKCLLFAGTVLFFLSDSILCAEMCAGENRAKNPGAYREEKRHLFAAWALMMLYYAGQLLIAGSLQWF